MMESPKYIDLLTDFGFKRVFGDKELLIAFLNALFESEGKVIKSVTYINKEMTPMSKDDRTIIYDVLCKVDGEEDFILEMQHKPQETFRERSLYYMARAIEAQGRGKRNWKYKLHPVYGIFITNFHLKEVDLPDEPVTKVALMNCNTNKIFTNKLRMFFIDLLCFKKKNEDELENNLERWIYSIRNMGTMTTAPRMAKMPTFNRLYTVSELAAMTTRQRNQYERSLKQHRDMLADKETTKIRMQREREEGLMEGMEKGREEGREEGERTRAIQNALQMIADKMPVELIAKYSGLSIEEIENL